MKGRNIMKLARRHIVLISIFVAVILLLSLFLAFFTKPIVLYKAKLWYEYDIWSSFREHCEPLREQDETAPKEATVTFNGVTYTGAYDSTMAVAPYPFKMHQYDGDNVYFDINSDTGELVSISLTRDTMQYISTVDEEYCRQIADALADDYIDLKKYKVESEKLDFYDNFRCRFNYYREIGGYKTADGLEIIVDGNGEILLFRSYILGSFSNVLHVKKLDEDKVDETLNEAILKFYEPLHEKERIEYKMIDDVMLIKTPDNKIAYLYYVNTYSIIKYTLEDGTEGEFSRPTQLYYILF